MTTYTKKTQIAIRKHGEETCVKAYDRHTQGDGARTVAIEVTGGTFNTADAAINAGREISAVAGNVVARAEIRVWRTDRYAGVEV